MDATGTLAIHEGSSLHLGGTLTFDVTYDPGNLDKKERGGVRIQVLAYDPTTHELIYGMAGHYDDAFVLGGGASQWLTQGGPATCHADLFYWDYRGGVQRYVPLAGLDFDAAG